MTPAVVKPQSLGTSMTLEERSNLILALARVLYINGESTQRTASAAERLSCRPGLRVTFFPHWGELEIQIEDTDRKFISAIEVPPSGVNMERVASTLETVDQLCEGRLDPANAMEAINKIPETPPTCTWLFALAAAVAVVAFAVVFGLVQLTNNSQRTWDLMGQRSLTAGSPSS